MTPETVRFSPASDDAGDIPLFKVFVSASAMESLGRVLQGGYVGEGPVAEAFERALAPWVGTEAPLALNSGTSALQLAMHLAGLGPGEEVITTPLTCVATNLAILHRGARVVWGDVDPETGNLDPDDVRRRITSRTRAVVAVHWGGAPCDLDVLGDLAREHGLTLIEDAGHAMGATWRGRPIGSHSDFVCFSFQAVKVFTTVDGGALCCRSELHRERGRLLRWYGLDRRERRRRGIDDDSLDIVEAGWKYHMNDVTATIGMEQLRHLEENLTRARDNARHYDDAFADLGSVRALRPSPGGESSRWLYTVRVRDLQSFREAMASHGVAASQVHVRNDRYRVFREFRTHLPGLDDFTAHSICIPVGWWVGESERGRVVRAVRAYDEASSGREAQVR